MVKRFKTDTIGNHTLPKIKTGADEFYDLVVNNEIFVDKSLMIKELLETSGKVLLITRPRCWGKSLNMDMLRKFFEIEVDENGQPLPEANSVHHKLFIGGAVDLGFNESKKLPPLKIANHAHAMVRQGKFPVKVHPSINTKIPQRNFYLEVLVQYV